MDNWKYAQSVEEWSQSNAWLYEACTALEHLRLPRGALVLDVGCNTGQLMSLLSRLRMYPVGVEVNKAALIRMEERFPNHAWQVYPTIEEASAAMSGGFDAVVMSHVICHMPHPERAIKDAYAALRPGGRIAIMTPNPIYDRLMIPWNRLTGYRSDPTILHEVGMARVRAVVAQLPNAGMKYFYLGEHVKWLPSILQPDWFKAHAVAVIQKRRSLKDVLDLHGDPALAAAPGLHSGKDGAV